MEGNCSNENTSETLTRITHYQVTHTWAIENFSQFFTNVALRQQSQNESIFSKMFSCDEDSNTKWILELFPYGDTKTDAIVNNNNSDGHMSFFVKLDKSSSTDITNLHARYFIYILGDDRSTRKVSSDNVFKRGTGWGRSVFLKYDELMTQKQIYLKHDTFKIRCTVTYIKPTTNLAKRKKSISSVSTESPHKILNIEPDNRLGSLSPSNNNVSHHERSVVDFHDIILSVGGTEIYAHKWILTKASPQLAKLVQGADRVVVVEDEDASAFAQMVRFIYTGDCDLDSKTCQLMKVAGKFQIQPLLNKLESHLVAMLNKTNCFMVYSWADLCKSAHLKAEAFKIIESLETGQQRHQQHSSSLLSP